MNYNKEDFTEENYKKLLKKITNQTVFYQDFIEGSNFTLWRHDVDFSVHRSLSLAKIENVENIKATYFFQLGSMFYNIFEQGIKEKILKIKELGHQIALHFDPTQYNINAKKDLEKYLQYEKNILETLFDIKINVFSFHNPTVNILKYDEWEYAEMINTYSKYFKEKVKYCSDSNGYWRHERLEDFLDKNYKNTQVLTHPAWWQKNILNPRARIQGCIDGRSKNISDSYDATLKIHERKNI